MPAVAAGIGWLDVRHGLPLGGVSVRRMILTLMFPRGLCGSTTMGKSLAMKRRDFLERWGLSCLKIKLGFLEGQFNPHDPDREAAWDLYVELLTRVTTQGLAPGGRRRENRAGQRPGDLSADPRDSETTRLGLRGIRQARHPGAQPDHSPVHGEMASTVAGRCFPGCRPLSRISR